MFLLFVFKSRVVAMDMRGFGDTDKPRGADNYKLEHLVKDLELFIGGLGKLSGLGLSMIFILSKLLKIHV